MTARNRTKGTSHTLNFDDEFEPYLKDAKRNPAFRAAYEDADHLARTVDTLVHHRQTCRVSQSEVARRMGVRQPTVSQFENEGSDPRLSTLQRYARAIGARLRLIVDVSASCDWVSSSTVTYRVPSGSAVGELSVRHRSDLPSSWASEQSARERRRTA